LWWRCTRHRFGATESVANVRHVGLLTRYAELVPRQRVPFTRGLQKNVVRVQLDGLVFHIVHGPLGEILVARPATGERSTLLPDDASDEDAAGRRRHVGNHYPFGARMKLCCSTPRDENCRNEADERGSHGFSFLLSEAKAVMLDSAISR